MEAEPITRSEPVQALGAPLINFRDEVLSVTRNSTGISPYGYSETQPEGFAVWRVIPQEEPSRDDFAEERFSFEADYLMLQQLSVIEEWLADLREQADYEALNTEDDAPQG